MLIHSFSRYIFFLHKTIIEPILSSDSIRDINILIWTARPVYPLPVKIQTTCALSAARAHQRSRKLWTLIFRHTIQ